MDIKNQFNNLIKDLKKLNNDVSKDCIDYIEEIISSCGRYVERVTATEAAFTIARFRMEPEAYREYVTELDRSRKIAHDTVMVNIAILNRYCRLVGVQPIYTGDLNDRITVADFAMRVCNTFFKIRKL